jgi:hypothetical protein
LITQGAWSYVDIVFRRNIQNPPFWNGPNHILDTKHDRKFIHVGDWNGDGLCDILAVDRLTGNVDMWRNTYKEGNAVPTFDAWIRVVDSNRCPQPVISSSLYDLAVRFGDLDGDRRVDVGIRILNTKHITDV